MDTISQILIFGKISRFAFQVSAGATPAVLTEKSASRKGCKYKHFLTTCCFAPAIPILLKTSTNMKRGDLTHTHTHTHVKVEEYT